MSGYLPSSRTNFWPWARRPDLVLVQAGVGALTSATIRHWKASRPPHPMIISVEPERAAFVLATMETGVQRLVLGPHDSVMTGLNCGLVSPVALPTLLAGLTAL